MQKEHKMEYKLNRSLCTPKKNLPYVTAKIMQIDHQRMPALILPIEPNG